MARFLLPEASPTSYLRWLAFWREIEQRMVERPSLEAAASEASAPFISDQVAQTISNTLVPQIVEEARAAETRGDRTVAPALEADHNMVVQAVRYVRSRVAFLTPDVCKAMGVEPLDPALIRLRDAVLQAIEDQLQDPSL